ncbi:hypothetical protein CERSUDRAFT_93776 [Gelatoporia subvermispora B]|uniref:CCHC-type domain-containing protein n=1 Tax=Ceriporiopsis subvermispora (strain B) TaxID=914234 RepID=M2PP50_CERS8|nr:hypothetical protein CERSUDRAFT_93776 [Gelatoporia subvermispora B]
MKEQNSDSGPLARTSGSNPPPLFFESPPDGFGPGMSHQDSHIYNCIYDDALGTAPPSVSADATDTNIAKTHRCFNCGSPSHPVATCPEPPDRVLIALSRQLYNFYKDLQGDGSGTSGQRERVYQVEAWRTQRRAWLSEFEPGQVRGEALRDALGLKEGDDGERAEWLKRMSDYGYPPGWVGDEDPRERVWSIIENENDDGEDEDVMFAIVGEEGVEQLKVPAGQCLLRTRQPVDRDDLAASEAHSNSDSNSRSASPMESTESAGLSSVRRWATYSETYFLNTLLPVYNGYMLPMLGSAVDSRLTPALLPNGPSGWPTSQLPPPPPTSPPPLPDDPPPPFPPPIRPFPVPTKFPKTPISSSLLPAEALAPLVPPPPLPPHDPLTVYKAAFPLWRDDSPHSDEDMDVSDSD